MAHIDVINYDDSTGELREIYDDLISSRGKLAGVHAIQSLRPKSIVKHIDLYMEIMFSKSELSRANREMIAVIVSASNKCDYCQIHHAAALNHYWKDQSKLEKLKRDFRGTDLSEKEMALCDYAALVTLDPGQANNENFTLPLKAVGFSDSAVLDATLVVAYFNFVNRIVLSLDVATDKEEAEGYKY